MSGDNIFVGLFLDCLGKDQCHNIEFSNLWRWFISYKGKLCNLTAFLGNAGRSGRVTKFFSFFWESLQGGVLLHRFLQEGYGYAPWLHGMGRLARWSLQFSSRRSHFTIPVTAGVQCLPPCTEHTPSSYATVFPPFPLPRMSRLAQSNALGWSSSSVWALGPASCFAGHSSGAAGCSLWVLTSYPGTFLNVFLIQVCLQSKLGYILIFCRRILDAQYKSQVYSIACTTIKGSTLLIVIIKHCLYSLCGIIYPCSLIYT